MRNRGIQEHSGTKKIYLTVSKGEFAKRVKEPTQKSTPRTLEKGSNKGTTIHEEKFDTFVGKLVGIQIEEQNNQFGKSWEFKIDVTPTPDAQPEYFILKLPYASGYAIDVLKRLPNVDTSDDIIWKGYNFKPEGEDKNRIGLTLSQWDANDKSFTIKNAFEKGSLPDWEKVDAPDGSGKVWSKVKFMQALEAAIMEGVAPGLEGTAKPVETEVETPEAIEDEEEVDVPF